LTSFAPRGLQKAKKGNPKKVKCFYTSEGFRLQASGFRDGLILHTCEREGPSHWNGQATGFRMGLFDILVIVKALVTGMLQDGLI
jgi:hypothetical protein